MKKQSGFAILELVAVVALIAVIGGAVYYAWYTHSQSNSTASSYQSPQVTVSPAPQVTKASDLNSAMQALNSADITANTTDSSQLSTQTSGF